MNERHRSLQERIADPGRRGFLLSTLLGLLAGRALSACDASQESARSGAQAPPWLLKITGEREAVVRIGTAYLRAHPEERRAGRVMAELERALTGQAGNTVPDEPAAQLAALQRLVRNDYQHGRVVQVDGWLLSRTEARLYAAVALLAD